MNVPRARLLEWSRFRGSLALSLVRTLLLFTLIPLLLMASAAYTRTRALLKEQVVAQNQRLMTTQLEQLETTIKTKEIRLDRLTRRGDFGIAIELALHANPKSETFADIRNNLLAQFVRANEEDQPVFNQFLIVDTDGKIQIASKKEWEGAIINNIESLLANEEHRTALVYDFQPFYPNQVAILTVVRYKTASGSLLGTVIGITESQSAQEALNALINLSPTADAYYVLPANVFISADPYTRALTPFNPSASQQNAIVSAFQKTKFQKDISLPTALEFDAGDNVPMLAQAIWLPSINAGIVLQVRQQEIFGQLNSLASFTMLLILASLGVMGVVIWAGSNRVVRPLRALADINRRFAEGDWKLRAEVKSRDEVGMLSASFNQMADELSELYRSLEQKVDARTRQLHTAAEVAQNITATTNMDELLNKTARLIVDQFGFYHAGIFLVDNTGKYANLRAAYSPAAQTMLERGHRLQVGSTSIIGWVTANNKPRVASEVGEDPVHFMNELLPETRSEVGIPIAIGNTVLGALDVQSVEPSAFSPEAGTIILLQTLANQIATALQNITWAESAHVNVQELDRLYRASRLIAESDTEDSALAKSGQVLRDSPYSIAFLVPREQKFNVLSMSAEFFDPAKLEPAIDELNSSYEDALRSLDGGPVLIGVKNIQRAPMLYDVVHGMGCLSGAFIPVHCNRRLAGVILIVSIKQIMTNAIIQPYASLADLLKATLEKFAVASQTQYHLTEIESLMALSQAISEATNMQSTFEALHEQVRRLIGEYSFTIALYHEDTDAISIPYSYEDGNIAAIDPFPLGQGLTSVLIHTRQPLLLVEDTEKKAQELGAKIVGRPARSWMGAPMLIQNKVIGALLIQDAERDHAFNESNLRFFTALASQVAGVINNIMLLEESRLRTVQLQTAAEIARDISGSLDLDELLVKAINMIRDRFSFYHASVFLLDLPGEFIVIREATGEAGAQLKRNGYKLPVGSKSIMGYVASHGEPLIVNDTANDATYLANPLLPETRAEACLPLKVGERILGVLDAQSAVPHSFTEDNLRALQILADQLAIAVVNTELFAETQEHLSQHRLLHHITTTTASGTTLEEALESAVTGLQVSLGGDRVSILLADSEKKTLEVKAAVGYSEDISNAKIAVGSGVTGWVAAHRRPLRLENVKEDARYIQLSSNTRSELAVPLIYRNELLGVMNIESEKLGAYTENDEEMLGTLGGSLAAIIANAKLLEQIRNQAERERQLFEVSSKIRRSTDIETILTTTASELTRLVGAQHARIVVTANDNETA